MTDEPSIKKVKLFDSDPNYCNQGTTVKTGQQHAVALALAQTIREVSEGRINLMHQAIYWNIQSKFKLGPQSTQIDLFSKDPENH